MAAGDFVWFGQGLLDLGKKVHDLDADTFKFGIVTDAVVPSKTTAAPHWGGTGTTNLATNEVATGTSYNAGGITVSPCTWALNGASPELSAVADLSIAQDATGFSDGYWGILYNATDAKKRALGFMDLGGPKSLVGGQFDINLDSAGGASTKMLKLTN